MWNTKSSKQAILIRERTNAQILHMLKMKKMKSNIDHVNMQWSTKSLSVPASSRGFLQKSRMAAIQLQNSTLVTRIGNLEKLRKLAEEQKKKSAIFSSHLADASNRKRSKILKNIKTENEKMFNRIVKVSPTLHYKQWTGEENKVKKYKQNIQSSRYSKPDYSEQAKRILNDKSKSFNHLRFHCIDRRLPLIVNKRK